MKVKKEMKIKLILTDWLRFIKTINKNNKVGVNFE